ncbi:MAG: hypothetical protein H7A25_25230 [Leptospiraceae bacterium]|nr:hypothetical protein [Leptospiraceae bacterium]MCP5503225.1 hypothetical protein [Leptospiraceae bacterium]
MKIESKLRIKKNVLSRLLPIRWLKYLAFSLFLLFISPFLLLYAKPSLPGNEKLFHYIIFSLSFLFCIDALLFGIIFLNYKLPILQEWKDKLGYIE